MKWVVYKHTNNINGKVYIGKTCKKPEHRWNAGKGYKSQGHFWHAIQKYGWENFSHEILASDLTSDEAKALEIQLIAEYGSMNPDKGYNQTAGGEGMLGWHHTPESLAKIRLSNSIREVTEETKKKMSEAMKDKYKGEKNPFYGKKHSESTMVVLKEKAKSRWENPEYKNNVLNGIRSVERNRKISERKKQQWKDPEYSKKMREIMNSEEYKNKISKKNKGRKHTLEELQKMSERATGEKNGMYGKRGKDNPNSKPVIQYDLNGTKIAEFENATEAKRITGVSNGSIGRCCKGEIAKAGGYIWKYKQ